MSLKAAEGMVLVEPTGDDNETERGGLFVVSHEKNNEHTVYRGVVLHVGARVDDALQTGNTIHYSSFWTLYDKHVVPRQHVIAFEDDE